MRSNARTVADGSAFEELGAGLRGDAFVPGNEATTECAAPGTSPPTSARRIGAAYPAWLSSSKEGRVRPRTPISYPRYPR
jgi:hypothetical protein